MGLTRVNQLLAAVEATEGGGATFNTTHFVDARSLARSINQDIEDEVVSGGSLSSDLGTVGRGSCGFTFNTYHYGFNGSILPLDDPLLRASGMQVSAFSYFTVSVAPTVATWAGMTIVDSSAGTAILCAPIGTSGRCYFTDAAGGFPNADTTLEIQGVASSGFTIASATPAGTCYAYRPDSTPTAIVLLPGAWTGNAPIAGDLVTNNLNGANAARGIVVTIGAGFVEIQPILPGRAFLATETIQGTAVGRTGTNTVDTGGQVLQRVPSLAMKGNIGGHAITGVGMRGNLTVNLEAGKIGIASWDFQGSRSATASEPPLTGVTTVTSSGLPRWQSATASIDGFEVPLSTLNLSMGNTVSLLADAHGSQGVRGSAITSRQPTVTANYDAVDNSVYNFDTRLANATTASVFTMWGTTVGLRVALWIPRGQIYSRADGDREGTLTADLTIRPKRRTANGDDEVYLMFGV
jgi:hypothetical protein